MRKKPYTRQTEKAANVDGLSPDVLNEFKNIQKMEPKSNEEIIRAVERLSMTAREAEDARRYGSDFRAFSAVARDLVGRVITRTLDRGRPSRLAHSYVTGVEVIGQDISLTTLTVDSIDMLGKVRAVIPCRLGILHDDFSLRGNDIYIRGSQAFVDMPEGFAELNTKLREIAEAVNIALVPGLKIEPRKTKFKYGRPPKTSTRQRKKDYFYKGIQL